MAWDLFLTLPNLHVGSDLPFESDHVCICSAEDPRLSDLADTRANSTALRMLGRFKTYKGKAYRPACLLVRTDAGPMLRTDDALRTFRNACAVSAVSRGVADAIRGSQGVAVWSDFFTFSYFVADKTGSVQTLTGPSRGYDAQLPHMMSNPAIGDPSQWQIRTDTQLCNRLLDCWKLHVHGKRKPFTRRLFRALEVAFHAAQYPGDGLLSINDIGTRIALWVSAFEVLLHPGTVSVNKGRVLNCLGDAPLNHPSVKAKRYTALYGGQDIKVGVSGDIYDDLYAARNLFLHGSPVSRRTLRYRRSARRIPLLTLAPLVFNVALIAHLEKAAVPDGPVLDENDYESAADYLKDAFRRRGGIDAVQDALDAARYPLDKYGKSTRPEDKGWPF